MSEQQHPFITLLNSSEVAVQDELDESLLAFYATRVNPNMRPLNYGGRDWTTMFYEVGSDALSALNHEAIDTVGAIKRRVLFAQPPTYHGRYLGPIHYTRPDYEYDTHPDWLCTDCRTLVVDRDHHDEEC